MNHIKEQLIKSRNEHIQVFEKIDDNFIDTIIQVSNRIYESFENGGKLFLFGNGGSASDAQHIAAEFSGRFVKERKSLPALALNTDTSALTAIGNDYGYETIFVRQLEGLIQKNDVVLGISTSGNSHNVLNAISYANKLGNLTISMTGNDGGRIGEISSINLNIPIKITARIQEAHIFIGHLICQYIDELY